MMKPPMLTGESTFDTNTIKGSAYAVGALFSLSLKFVITRSIKEVNVLTMTFFIGSCGIIVALTCFLAMDRWDAILPKSKTEFILTASLFSYFICIITIGLALKMENVTTVALVRSFDVLSAFLLQFVFLGIVPDILR